MGVRKRHQKADFIEDIIGTEPLSGTYKSRARMAKILDHEKRLQEHQYLESLRKKKEEYLKNQLEASEKLKYIDQNIGYVLGMLLEPDARQYLNNLRVNENSLCNKIVYALIPPNQMMKLDSIVEALQVKGSPKKLIKLSWILKLEAAFRKYDGK